MWSETEIHIILYSWLIGNLGPGTVCLIFLINITIFQNWKKQKMNIIKWIHFVEFLEYLISCLWILAYTKKSTIAWTLKARWRLIQGFTIHVHTRCTYQQNHPEDSKITGMCPWSLQTSYILVKNKYSRLCKKSEIRAPRRCHYQSCSDLMGDRKYYLQVLWIFFW